MAVSFSRVRKALDQHKIDPVYYLTGEEDLLKDELIDVIVDAAVDPTCRDFNLDTRSASSLDAESLNALIETPPMLAERRVAVIRGLEVWRKNSKQWKTLLSYLNHPSPTTTLVLVSGPGADPEHSVVAAGTHVVLDAPQDSELQDWVITRAQRLGLTFDNKAVAHLIEAVGGGPTHLAPEIDKLAAATTGDTVTVRDVESLVGIRHGETLTDWLEATIDRDIPRSVRLLDIVLPQSGNTAVKMLNTLGTYFVGVRHTRAHLDSGTSDRNLGKAVMETVNRVRPYGLGSWSRLVKAWTKAAPKWSPGELDDALRTIYASDQQLKSTTLTDARGTLHTMLLHFGAHEEAA